MDRLSKKFVDDTMSAPNKIIPMPAQRLYLCHTEPVVHDVKIILQLRQLENDVTVYYKKTSQHREEAN